MVRNVANELNKSRSIKHRESVKETSDHFSIAQGNSKTNENYRQLMREMITSPAVKYVSAGIAVSILTRLATNISTKYPEISRFLKENVDRFEKKLGLSHSRLNEQKDAHM